MKFNMQSILSALCWFTPLLICALISLLYACDFISTSLFTLLNRINGCLFYLFIGTLLFKIIKKRQLFIALSLSILFLLIHLSTQSEWSEHLFFGFKLILFNAAVLFLLLKRSQSR